MSRARPAWIAPSAWVILVARSLRAFATGLLGVIIALFLGERGLGLPEIGLFLSAGVVGGGVYAAALGGVIGRLGRRRSLTLFTVVSSAAAGALLLEGGPAWLIGCSAVGALAGVGGAGGGGPAEPVEQAILADHCEALHRPALFALYRVSSSLSMALGGLAAGVPAWLGVERGGLETMVGVSAAVLLGVALVYLALPASVETDPPTNRFANPLRTPSRRLILRLNGLFAVDQLGSALTTASLMTYWFHVRFDIELAGLATLAFAGQLLASASMWLSVRLSARIGLVRTMVFTHLPASLLLVVLAFVENPALGVAIWLARGLLSQMDIPARDALTMAVVHPGERVAMASVHIVARNGVGTVGPSLGTALWQGVSASAPIALGGLLKTGYDLALYFVYRDVEHHRASEA